MIFFLTGCSYLSNSSSVKDSTIHTVDQSLEEGSFVVGAGKNRSTAVSSPSSDISSFGGEKEFYDATSYSNISVEVEVGQRVLVEADGTISQSYPGRAKAKKANSFESQALSEAIEIADTKSNSVTAIRYVIYEDKSDSWKIGIKQEEDIYEIEIEDK